MAGFSATEAIGSGFRLIAREPKAVLAWIGLYLAVMAVQYAIMWAAMPDIIGYYQALGRGALEGGAEPDDAEVLGMVSKMFAVMPFLLILGLAFLAVFLGAIYRAVLDPEDRRLAYLRFGRKELWLLLTMLAWFLLMTVVYIALMIPAALVGGLVAGLAAGQDGAPAMAVLPMTAVILVVWLVCLWLALRFSLALPMSFDEGRFRLFQSWAMTRGQSLKILGVGIALVLLVCVLQVLIVLVFGLAVVAVSGLGSLHQVLVAPPEDLIARLFPWMIVLGVIGSALGVVAYVIMGAPIADIYRQLRASAAAGAGI